MVGAGVRELSHWHELVGTGPAVYKVTQLSWKLTRIL